MATVDYEEKQYEQAANIELGTAGASVFSAGQVSEAVLGYDAAVGTTTPSSRRLIEHLLGRSARGIRLSPTHWQGCRESPKPGKLPGRWVSLLVQYKRPEKLKRPPLEAWRGVPPPYYRFPLTNHQHDILLGLERNLGRSALVRYAAPCLPDAMHLETAQVRRQVLEHSHFVAPRDIGAGHDAWTYRYPFHPGYPNQEGEAGRGEDIYEVAAEVARRGEERVNVGAHLATVTGQLSDALPELPGFEDLDVDLEPDELWVVVASARLSAFLGDLGTSWWLWDASGLGPYALRPGQEG